METSTTDLYTTKLGTALSTVQTELDAFRVFSEGARDATAAGDEDRAARQRALAATAIDGARRIGTNQANFFRRLAARRADRGDDAGASEFEGFAAELEHLLETHVAEVTGSQTRHASPKKTVGAGSARSRPR